jgi:multidrug efflux system membrane fusion protein
VWVIGNDDKLSLRVVRVATYGDDGVHVAEGLAAGERIVTAGVNRLYAGEKVVVSDASAGNKPASAPQP